MTIESLATRLKALRESKGLTKYRLAKLSGISQTYLYRLERGEIENPRRDTLQAIAKGLNIPLAQLIGEIAPSDTWELVEQSLKAYIPVYTGVYEVGMEPVDYVVCTRVEAPSDTLRAYRIEGLSLDPEIRVGDTVIVDIALPAKNGDLLLVMVDNRPSLKRYNDNAHGVWLEDNDGRCELESVSVHGTVTAYQRTLR